MKDALASLRITPETNDPDSDIEMDDQDDMSPPPERHNEVIDQLKKISEIYDIGDPKSCPIDVWDVAMQECRAIPHFEEEVREIINRPDHPLHQHMKRALTQVFVTICGRKNKNLKSPEAGKLAVAPRPKELVGMSVNIFYVDRGNALGTVVDLVSPRP